MSDICARCEQFRQFHGENSGLCYGLPPVIYPSGAQQVNPPRVKLDRPACGFFKKLPLAEPTRQHAKASPETVGDALKQAREIKTTTVVTPVKLPQANEPQTTLDGATMSAKTAPQAMPGRKGRR